MFWRTSVLFVGYWYPCFGLLVASSLGFKVRVDHLAYMLHHLHAAESSDSPLMWTCWPLGDQNGSQTIPIQVLVNKHWWGSSPGPIIPLPQSVKRSTNWAMLARLIALMLEYGFRKHTKALTLILTFGLSIPYRLKYTKLFVLIFTLSPASVVIPLIFSYCSTFITNERPHWEPVQLETMMLNEWSGITNYPIKK